MSTVLELSVPLPGWTIAWRTSRSGFRQFEVATSPEGVEYVKTPSRELADLIVKTKHAGESLWKLRSRPFPNTQETA